MKNIGNISQPLTLPLPIEIQKNTTIQNEQYSIKNNCFDPNQNSPPSVWKIRLNKRLGDNPIKYQQHI